MCGGDVRGLKITCCPHRIVTRDIWLLYDVAAPQAKRGNWPTGAGWLDQPECLVDGVRAVWAEQAYWRHKLRLRDDE